MPVTMIIMSWYNMDSLSELLSHYVGNPPVTGGVDSPHKGPVTHALMFYFMSARTNNWTKSRVASDLR